MCQHCIDLNVFKVYALIPGLTDEEVELAIQRSGSTEVLPLTPAAFPHPPYAAQPASAPPCEYI